MTESCEAMTAPRLASIASSQSAKNPSGCSATPSRDISSYATTLRTLPPPDGEPGAKTARATGTHRGRALAGAGTERSTPVGEPPAEHVAHRDADQRQRRAP